MSVTYTVVCPNCGNTSTYTAGLKDGTVNPHCKSCHKGFHVHIKKGNVDKVSK